MPHAIHVTTANITDRTGAIAMVTNSKEDLSDVKNFLVDGGYGGDPFAIAIKDTLGATVEIAKRNELHTFAVIPQRWIVERSFGWIEKSCRLWENCERKLNTSLQMIVLRFVELLLKRF